MFVVIILWKQHNQLINWFSPINTSKIWLHYSNQMIKPVSRPLASGNKSIDKSKGSTIDQSTRIKQSQSITLVQPPRHHSHLSSVTKYHQCCNSISTHHHHSFHPNTTSLPFTLYPENCTALARSKKEQWECLTQDNRARGMQRTQLKLREEEERLRQCTFSPRITPFQISAPKTNEDVHTKLYKEAEQRRQEQIEAERKQLQKQRLQIANLQNREYDASKWKMLNTERFDLQPLYRRLQKVIQDKKKNRKMIAEKEQQEYSFKPQLNDASKKIIEKKGMVENVVDRLIEDFMKRQNRINVLRENMEANFKKECPFTPIINNYLPTQAPKINRDRKENYNHNTFTPSINPISALMMQERHNQTTEQKYFRMIHTPAIKKADKISEIQAQVYAECCFNPQINEISKQIQGGGQKHHVCEIPKPESPTHRPSINQVSRLMSEAKRAKSLDNIKRKTKEKEENYKQQMEYSKMKECTFKPRIKDNKSVRNMINTQIKVQDVAGFQQFFETRQKYNEKERARKLLEERLFQLEKSYDLRMSREKQNGKA